MCSPLQGTHISENILEQALWPKIEHFIQKPKQAIEALHKKLAKSSEYNFYKEQSKDLKKQIEKLKQREEILPEVRLNDQISSEGFSEKMDLFKRETFNLKEELEGVESMLTSKELEREKIASAKQILKKYQKKLSTLTYQNKCDLIKIVVKRIVINGEEVNMELFVPKKSDPNKNKVTLLSGSATENRTPVTGMKIRRPNH